MYIIFLNNTFIKSFTLEYTIRLHCASKDCEPNQSFRTYKNYIDKITFIVTKVVEGYHILFQSIK